MTRNRRIAGMLRGMTGLSQRQFAKQVGLHHRQIAAIEGGEVEATAQDLQRIARGVGMTAADADELLRHGEALVQYERRQEQGAEEVLPELMDRLRRHLSESFLRLLALPRPRSVQRRGVEELMDQLRACSPEARIWIVRVAAEYQSRELCERVREEAVREAAGSPEGPADWENLAKEIDRHLAGDGGS